MLSKVIHPYWRFSNIPFCGTIYKYATVSGNITLLSLNSLPASVLLGYQHGKMLLRSRFGVCVRCGATQYLFLLLLGPIIRDFFLCYVNQPLVFGTDPECILHAFQNNYHSLVFINRLSLFLFLLISRYLLPLKSV